MPTLPSNVSIRDISNETSSINLNLEVAGTETVSSIPDILLQVTDNAVSANMILGLPVSGGVTVKAPMAYAGPISNNAHRELKWLIFYRDTSQYLDAGNTVVNPYYNKIFKNELPTANGALLSAGSDTLDFSAGAVNTFVQAYEDVVRSPVGGTIQVVEIRLVGRNI